MKNVLPYPSFTYNIPVPDLYDIEDVEDGSSGVLVGIKRGDEDDRFETVATIRLANGRVVRTYLKELVRERKELRRVIEAAMQSHGKSLKAVDQGSSAKAFEERNPILINGPGVFVLDQQDGQLTDNFATYRLIHGRQVLDWAGATGPAGYLYGTERGNNDVLFGAVTDEGFLVGAGDGVGSASRHSVERFIEAFRNCRGDIFSALNEAAKSMYQRGLITEAPQKGVCISAMLARIGRPVIYVRMGDCVGRVRSALGTLIGSVDSPLNTTTYDPKTHTYRPHIPTASQSAMEYLNHPRHQRAMRKFYRDERGAYAEPGFFGWIKNRLGVDGSTDKALEGLAEEIEERTRVTRGRGKELNEAFDHMLRRIIEGKMPAVLHDPWLYRYVARIVRNCLDPQLAVDQTLMDVRKGPVLTENAWLEGGSDGWFQNLRPHGSWGPFGYDDEMGQAVRHARRTGGGPSEVIWPLAHQIDRRVAMYNSPDAVVWDFAFRAGYKSDHASGFSARIRNA